MNLLIKNVNLIDESNNFFGDIYIEKGVIKELGTELNKECETLDGKGLVLMPAFIDTHAHLEIQDLNIKRILKVDLKQQ